MIFKKVIDLYKPRVTEGRKYKEGIFILQENDPFTHLKLQELISPATVLNFYLTINY